jgi:hypothetical protein
MQITIQEVAIEEVRKGNNKPYYKANVVYSSNGKNSTKPIMSFANPQVYDAIKDATPGSDWEIDVKKEGDYWNWVGAKPAGGSAPTQAPRATATTAIGGKTPPSTYETADERRIKQMYIIKQSSIANAIDYLKVSGEPFVIGEVLSVAQQFVDFVYGTPARVDIFNEPNDIPY